MGDWPSLHTWADYQVKLLDKDRTELGSLVNIHNLKGSVTLFGQYGAMLTFSININDKMSSIIEEKARHFIQVLRSGTAIFDGYTIKTTRKYKSTTRGLEEFIEVTCLPLSQVIGWRYGMPVTGSTLESDGRVADDGFKWLVERTHGATAPNSPTNDTARTLTGLTIEADSTEYPDNVTIKATGKQMYDFLVRMGARYEVDWWVAFDSSWNMEFKTKYPRRGVDRTEGNGVVTEVIFNDSADTTPSVEYGYDSSDTITAALNRSMTIDAEDATLQSDWLYRESVIETEDSEELEAELARRNLPIFYKATFQERPDLVWDPGDSVTGPHFDIGDKITYINKYLGYGPYDADIAKIEFEILANGDEKLTLTFGDPIPDFLDKQKKRGRAVAADAYTFLSYWRRGVIGSTVTGLYTGYEADPVLIGANSSANVANWITDGGYDTKLEVVGNVCVGRAVYCLDQSLVLAGHSTVDISAVHIYDPAGRDSTLDVYTGGAATPEIKFVSTLTEPSYLQGILEIHNDAAAPGAIAHSFNGTTGAVIFNEQGLDADFRIESDTLTDALSINGANGDVGIGRFPLTDLDVYRATGNVCVSLDSDDGSSVYVSLQNSEGSWRVTTDDGDWYVYDVNGYVTPLYLDGGAVDMMIHATSSGLVLNEGGAAAGDVRWEADTNDHALVLDATGTGTMQLNSGADTRWYSDVATTETASVDGSNGNATFGYGSAIPSIYLGDANTYIRTDATPQMILMTDKTYLSLAPGSSAEVIAKQGQFYPAGDDVTECGWLGQRRWKNIVSYNGNFARTVSLWSGADLNVFSDAGTTLVASIDGATGDIWALQTAKVGVGVTAGTYTSWIEGGYVYAGTGHMIDDSNVGMYESGGYLILLTDQAIISLSPGSSNEVYVEQGAMYPVTTDATSLGKTAGPLRWSNVVSVLGNFSSTVTTGHLTAAAGATYDVGSGTRYRDGLFSRNLDVDGTGNVQGTMTMQGAATVGTTLGVTGKTTCSGALDVTGNITVTGTVDGVDVLALYDAYVAHTHTFTDQDTGDWTATDDYRTESDNLTNGSNSKVYAYLSASSDGSSPYWGTAYIRQTTHTHNLDDAETDAP